MGDIAAALVPGIVGAIGGFLIGGPVGAAVGGTALFLVSLLGSFVGSLL